MPTITAAIDKLAKFSDKENISKIIEGLQTLKSPNDASDSVIEDLRKGLKNFLSQRNVKKDNISLADAAYDGLLALAEFKPLNKEDLITLLEIPKEDKIFVSTGHQFSLTNLIHYHHTRDYRSNLGETYQSKWLLNPFNNLQFDSIDIAHINTIAKERGITIENLKPEALLQQQVTHTAASTASFSNNNSSGSQYFVLADQPSSTNSSNFLRHSSNLNNELDEEQIQALQQLQQYGLTAYHLRGWHWEIIYAPDYRDALINLMAQRGPYNKTAEQAVTELRGLDHPEQVWGIAQGLNKSDVLGLNEEKIKAFLALRQYGLTANHLRGWTWEIVYASDYRKALINLMTQRGVNNKTADQAVAELKALHRWEVEKIADRGPQHGASSGESFQLEALPPQVTQTIIPSSVATVINEITEFFQRLFNTANEVTNTQTQTREDDFQEDRPSIQERYESSSYSPVFSHPGPLSQPSPSSNTSQEETPRPRLGAT